MDEATVLILLAVVAVTWLAYRAVFRWMDVRDHQRLWGTDQSTPSVVEPSPPPKHHHSLWHGKRPA